jgi:general secretion pathway protein H
MPISATGRPSDHARGFTLVELMIVILVIAVASAAVVWALPSPRARLHDEAARFALRVQAAQQAAVVGAHPVSLWVSAGGYGVDQRIGGAWMPAGDGPLKVAEWQPGTKAQLPVARERVTFDETGLADRPLEVALVHGRASAHVRIGPDGSARVDE